MNAAESQRRSEPFLPEINTNRRRCAQLRRKPEKTSDESAQILSKEEIALFRHSVKQSVCVQMLQEGFHRSFSELFLLLRADEDLRDLRRQAPLEQQKDKLETMRVHLSLAEQAERTGSWSVVCEQRLSLGQYFSVPEDVWLSLHFYHSCVDRQPGGSRPVAEARACMAELYLQRGELQQAKQQAELCIQQAEAGGWMDSAGRPLWLRARQTLWRIYSRLADAPLDAEDYDEALTLLHKGYSMAIESEDKQLEGEASYRLGLTYHSAGDHDRAKQFISTSMQIFGTLGNADGLGRCYKAMAKCMESEENVDETVDCLEKFADISRSNGLQHNLADAYLCLGNIYYRRNQYQKSSEFFLQSYEVACSLQDVDLLQRAQVWVASARAQTVIRKYSADVVLATEAALRRLLAWKQTRPLQEASRDDTDRTAAAAAAWYQLTDT
ncbi:tetratricopeptide repeat protein 29 isoform X2 [Acanthopagrus latus]|uniref:tetratricopeptide repeat protein 29 isoform X2 n=1 Tax=Acanthopagrus latus TaxID=8177 RepID=UPI00187BEE1B|nr:tetratricopeptide repeat protein 29 isoform X2 [Acanthopagrus latus]XP_036967354.1 tetratricopeptide repeat protein 29 isoform X2 [Acanthopagrus latus]